MKEALDQPCSACAGQEDDGEVSVKLAYIALSGTLHYLIRRSYSMCGQTYSMLATFALKDISQAASCIT